jgi:hypothetical protein
MAPLGGGRCWGKGVGGWIRCDKMYTHVSKCKNDNLLKPLQDNDREVNSCIFDIFMYDIFDTLCIKYMCKCDNVLLIDTTIKEENKNIHKILKTRRHNFLTMWFYELLRTDVYVKQIQAQFKSQITRISEIDAFLVCLLYLIVYVVHW